MRLKFSLRFALILLTCIAIALGFHIHSLKVRRDAVAAVEAVGSYTESIETSLPSWAIRLIGEEHFVRAEKVRALSDKLTDEHLESISNLREVRHISNNHMWAGSLIATFSISGAGFSENPLITDAGISHVAKIKKLESLVLFNSNITNEGVAKLQHLKHLKYLKICGEEIDDNSVPYLAKLTSLEQFWISGTSISNEGIERLRKALPNCKVIDDRNEDDGPFYAL